MLTIKAKETIIEELSNVGLGDKVDFSRFTTEEEHMKHIASIVYSVPTKVKEYYLSLMESIFMVHGYPVNFRELVDEFSKEIDTLVKVVTKK